MATVWQELIPENIFSAVEETLGTKLSNICLKRNSYINRVYELEKYDSSERVIVKFYRPGRWTPEMILEEHAFLAELYNKEIAVIPPLLHDGRTLFTFKNIPFAVFPKKGGRAIDEFDRDNWITIGRILARIHTVGEAHTTSKRVRWQPSVATAHHADIILKNDFIPPDFINSFKTVLDLFQKKAEPLFTGAEMFLLHGDCHKGNFIFRPGEGLFVVDFDDCCLGPAAQDLWMLLPDTVANSQNELKWFFEGYEVFRQFDRASLRLVPALRGMRIVHYAAWLAVQSKESDFEKNFPDAGQKKYWNGLIRELQSLVYEEL